MNTNNNLQILPWYSDKQYQDRFSPQYKKNTFKLVCGTTSLLPFQIMLEEGEKAIELYLITADSEQKLNIFNNVGLTYKNIAELNTDVLVHYGNTLLNLVLEQNMYYMSIKTNIGKIYYSEVFNVLENLGSYITLTYWDDVPFISNYLGLFYDGIFKNILYIASEVGLPEYPFEEVANDRDGYKFIESQISKKIYNVEFDAPEYICDALRILRMHTNIEIKDTRNRLYKILDVQVTPEWIIGGSLANIKLTFECDNNLKKLHSYDKQ